MRGYSRRQLGTSNGLSSYALSTDELSTGGLSPHALGTDGLRINPINTKNPQYRIQETKIFIAHQYTKSTRTRPIVFIQSGLKCMSTKTIGEFSIPPSIP